MNRRVLIVENECIVAADLEAKLAELGYDVVGIAASGEEALSIADRERPEIVLMDIQLRTAMSGREAAELIEQRIGAAIVFVTAFSAVLQKDSGAGSDEIRVSKPFSTVQLKQALQSAVGKINTR